MVKQNIYAPFIDAEEDQAGYDIIDDIGSTRSVIYDGRTFSLTSNGAAETNADGSYLN